MIVYTNAKVGIAGLLTNPLLSNQQGVFYLIRVVAFYLGWSDVFYGLPLSLS